MRLLMEFWTVHVRVYIVREVQDVEMLRPPLINRDAGPRQGRLQALGMPQAFGTPAVIAGLRR